VNEFAFGNPTKYLQMDPTKMFKFQKDKSFEELWDESLESVKNEYSGYMYDFFFNNCHNFVAKCLNHMAYENRKNWNVVELGWKLFFSNGFVNGKYGIFKTFWGFTLFIISLFVYVYFFKMFVFK
jgi:hypothetical protein